MNTRASNRQEGRGIAHGKGRTSLATEYFRSLEDSNRLHDMLTEKIVDLIGGIEPRMVEYLPYDDAMEVIMAANSLSVTPESQQKIFELGFKRIFLYHQNGYETYYYTGGDVRGYRKFQED
jgi:hypothetical protein